MKRLNLPFEQQASGIDERPRTGEDPESMVERLAIAKVEAVARQLKGSNNLILIGSDQTGFFAGNLIGKPQGRKQAVEQLLSLSGQEIIFYTSLCVSDLETKSRRTSVEQTKVKFRSLARREVEAYVEADLPFDAAGGFHAEGLGITLIESIQSKDPTSLIGLPLIRLAHYLREAGIQLP